MNRFLCNCILCLSLHNQKRLSRLESIW